MLPNHHNYKYQLDVPSLLPIRNFLIFVIEEFKLPHMVPYLVIHKQDNVILHGTVLMKDVNDSVLIIVNEDFDSESLVEQPTSSLSSSSPSSSSSLSSSSSSY